MEVPSAREDQSPVTPLTQLVPARALPSGASPAGNRARQWNRWRERYNPLRGLNVARCVTLLEQYQRGEMADPQWAYFSIEQSDADLFALLERREAALLQLDWNIKTSADRAPRDGARRTSGDEGLAREQCAALREAYESVDNLYEAIAHLQLATFRGFAHCEKYRRRDGAIFHLELVDQWNVVRDLLRGAWKYNPDALSTTFESISDDNLLDPANFLIRERDRHVNRLALLKFIRTNLSEKDWDAFIEIYGIPSGVVIGPAGVPPESEAEYKASAQAIAEGGSGYLPHGSDYKPNDQPRGSDPFRPRLDYLTEKLVLAGTGGLLTMLAQSGSGTLAGGAHAEAFATIARAEARKISEIFQRQFDREVLARHFPGCPTVAYFDLAAQEERDPGAVAGLAQKLAAAGYRIDVAQLAEKTGYKLVDTQAKANTSPEPTSSPNFDGTSLDELLLNINLRPEEIERWVTINGHRVPIRKKGSQPDAGKVDPAPSRTVAADKKTAGQDVVGQSGIAPQEPKNPGFMFGLFENPKEYLHEVGEIYKGYGDAAKEAASGIKDLVTNNPVETAKGIVHAATHPIKTAKAIWADTSQTWESGNRGKGKVVGDVLLGIATSGVGAELSASAKALKAQRTLKKAAGPVASKAPGRGKTPKGKISPPGARSAGRPSGAADAPRNMPEGEPWDGAPSSANVHSIPPAPKSASEMLHVLKEEMAQFEKRRQKFSMLAKPHKGSASMAQVKRQTQAIRELAALNREKLAHARQIVRVPSQGKVRFSGQVPQPLIKSVKDGAGIVEAYTHPDLLPTVKVARPLPIGKDPQFWNGEVFLSPKHGPLSAAHEIMHGVEASNPKVLEACKEFLKKRAKGRPPEKFSKLTGDADYPDNQIAYEDEWVKLGGHPYTGRVYREGHATEILTTGVTRLHRNPAAFARDDPEFFSFVVTTLHKW